MCAVHENNGDHDKAIADYTQAIRLNPKEATVHYNRGVAYGSKGEYDREIADCTEAIRLDPHGVPGVPPPRPGHFEQA